MVSVWSGRLLLWGGLSVLDDRHAVSYDLRDGRWQRLAEAPIDPRGGAAFTWTGTSLAIFGGSRPLDKPSDRDDGAFFSPPR
jgi:hypothetical protein